MNKFLALLLLLPSVALAQPVFPPATQSEVNAGTLSSKFVSPLTLANYGGFPSGSSNNANVNAGTLLRTNATLQVVTNIADGAFRGIMWNGPNYVRAASTTNATYILTNAPAAGTPARVITLELAPGTTSSGPTNLTIVSQTHGLDWGPDGGPIVAVGATNFYTFQFNGTNVLAFNGQSRVTGVSGSSTVLSNNPSISYLPNVIAGAGGGSTNYLVDATKAISYINGGANVNVYTVANTASGVVQFWNLIVTNLTASPTGIRFTQSTTNHWRFVGSEGTNMPTVLTNGSALFVSAMSEGTNVFVGYQYYKPGL